MALTVRQVGQVAPPLKQRIELFQQAVDKNDQIVARLREQLRRMEPHRERLSASVQQRQDDQRNLQSSLVRLEDALTAFGNESARLEAAVEEVPRVLERVSLPAQQPATGAGASGGPEAPGLLSPLASSRRIPAAAVDLPLPYFETLATQLEERAQQVWERVNAVESALTAYSRQSSGVPVASQIEAVVRCEHAQFRALASQVAQAAERLEQVREAAVRSQGVPAGMLARPADGGTIGRSLSAQPSGLHAWAPGTPAAGVAGAGLLGRPAGGGLLGQAPVGGLFGQPSAGGLVGQPLGGGLFGQPSGGGLFGQPSGGGLFGQPSGGGLFGQPSGGGLFGQPSGGGLFGQASGGGLFGQPSGGGLFGQSSSGSNVGLFGQNTGGGLGLFGQNSRSGGLFGQSSGGGGGLFGQSSGGGLFAQNTGGGLFGQSSGGGLFGQSSGGGLFAQNTVGGMFGQSSTGTSLFGQNTGGSLFGQGTGSSLFGQSASTSAFAPNSSGGLFGTQGTGGGLFGAANTTGGLF